jgi:diguanylate cyclase (GGDEF)-like protein
MDATQHGVSGGLAEQERAEAAGALTGLLHRRTGLAALQRELDRAHRTDSALTAAVVDVGGREPADDPGHRADEALLRVGCALLCSMRSYDLVIRVSGAGFVCALCGVRISGARTRFGAVQDALAQAGIAITVGCAELAATDTPATLIHRAGVDARPGRSPPGSREVDREPDSGVAP